MDPEIYCQSCSMPMDNTATHGTEKDGSPSGVYCNYCYQHGVFTNPGMTLKEMTDKINTMMIDMHLPEVIIRRSLDMLPSLKRWKNTASVQPVTIT